MKYYNSAYHMYLAFRNKFIYWVLVLGLYEDTEIEKFLKLFKNHVDKIVRRKDKTRNMEKFTYRELVKFVDGDIFEKFPKFKRSNLTKMHPNIDFTNAGTFAKDIFAML